jgi:predicted Fe-Mo cluster-binding NifX family protein
MHFGHCERFVLLDVNPQTRKIIGRADVQPPPHQPGLLPPWLAKLGVELVVAGGMGQHAQQLFATQNIRVVVGASSETPEHVVGEYLAGTLQLGENVCDH